MLFLELLVVLSFASKARAQLDVVTALKKEVQSLLQIHEAASVNAALSRLRQQLARAAGIFDPHTALAALGKTSGCC